MSLKFYTYLFFLFILPIFFETWKLVKKRTSASGQTRKIIFYIDNRNVMRQCIISRIFVASGIEFIENTLVLNVTAVSFVRI